jgi:hypothetical protein
MGNRLPSDKKPHKGCHLPIGKKLHKGEKKTAQGHEEATHGQPLAQWQEPHPGNHAHWQEVTVHLGNQQPRARRSHKRATIFPIARSYIEATSSPGQVASSKPVVQKLGRLPA